MRLLLPICLTILLVSTLATAQTSDISGKWTAETYMTTAGSEPRLATTFTFKVDGGTLTGTVSSNAGTFDIQEGKIDGDVITFWIDVTGSGKMLYDGRIVDEGLDFIAKIESGDRSDQFVAKRP